MLHLIESDGRSWTYFTVLNEMNKRDSAKQSDEGNISKSHDILQCFLRSLARYRYRDQTLAWVFSPLTLRVCRFHNLK